MFVDTGANVTLVRTDLAQKLKENFIYTAPNISLNTATGEKADMHGKLDAAIECGCRKFQHRIYVADITDPFILCLDFLQKFNFTVDLEKNEIRTGGEEIPSFSASAEHSKLCSVLAKEKNIIPARSECLIQGVPEVSGKCRYAVTDFPIQVSQKGVLVAATLVDLKREAIPVRVLNLDNKPKTVDKEAVIATCEPVVDIVARNQEFSESLRLPSILENLEGLNDEQQTAVKELLQEFQNLFSTSDSDVGRCNMTQHRINTGNHPPINLYPRRLPLAKKEEAEHLVKEMVDNGIIEESSVPWASPIVLVKKKDGSTRFCVDYRKLNEITIKDSYPLPRIDDTLDALNGNQWFSTIDLKIGYWQVKIQPEDNEKTAFTTGQGLWQFKIKVNWIEECEKSFNSIKQALITSPVFTYPRNDKEFILDTDASNKGKGAVLSQKIGNEEDPEGQIARWIQRLQEYEFEIQHRKGTSHGNADALSRRLCKESYKHCTNAEKKFGMETDISVRILTTEDAWSSSEVQKAQLEDPAIRPILEKKLNSEDRPSWQEIAPESPAAKRY
ncbi:Retrovirus-related Pol polyprotein from transposon 297 [Araneus ventricosus]|uniref:Retrovirus-related Pol polyprotein from transposon 297 n=1 Tax=Araneus ventricosus TaxID=182803 RepID=A0A4Y2KK51_ARAVE|nr:Retrovirus-related Pol polyprotein from transposon 297 [Araneus ventricosus]